jgi:hypothetical protein
MKRRLIVLSLLTAAAVAVGSASTMAADAPTSTAVACKKGTVPAAIGRSALCLAVGQRCQLKYQKAYRAHHFQCVRGRLQKLKAPPKPAPPPPPPPPPPAPAPPPEPPPPPPPSIATGHYTGTTSENEQIFFDVTQATWGIDVTDLGTGQINESCTPPYRLWGGNLRGWWGSVDQGDGTFEIDGSYQSTLNGTIPTSDTVSITGTIVGTSASGTIVVTSTFTDGGAAYSCSSGSQTWTATLSG